MHRAYVECVKLHGCCGKCLCLTTITENNEEIPGQWTKNISGKQRTNSPAYDEAYPRRTTKHIPYTLVSTLAGAKCRRPI